MLTTPLCFGTHSGYIPTWRSVCEKWIQEALEEKEGEVTPVYVLYNAYLKDNPQQYLDIAQVCSTSFRDGSEHI